MKGFNYLFNRLNPVVRKENNMSEKEAALWVIAIMSLMALIFAWCLAEISKRKNS